MQKTHNFLLLLVYVQTFKGSIMFRFAFIQWKNRCHRPLKTVAWRSSTLLGEKWKGKQLYAWCGCGFIMWFDSTNIPSQGFRRALPGQKEKSQPRGKSSLLPSLGQVKVQQHCWPQTWNQLKSWSFFGWIHGPKIVKQEHETSFPRWTAVRSVQTLTQGQPLGCAGAEFWLFYHL